MNAHKVWQPTRWLVFEAAFDTALWGVGAQLDVRRKGGDCWLVLGPFSLAVSMMF